MAVNCDQNAKIYANDAMRHLRNDDINRATQSIKAYLQASETNPTWAGAAKRDAFIKNAKFLGEKVINENGNLKEAVLKANKGPVMFDQIAATFDDLNNNLKRKCKELYPKSYSKRMCIEPFLNEEFGHSLPVAKNKTLKKIYYLLFKKFM